MRLKLLLFSLIGLSMISCADSEITQQDLRCEYRVNPLGIDSTSPRLSWKISGDREDRGTEQVAYQILVASSLDNLNKDYGDLWDSGRVKSNQSVNNRYAGEPLESGQECYWKVRTWVSNMSQSSWSDTALFTMGLLKASEWKGEWIHRNGSDRTVHNWYRRNFTLENSATSAYISVGSFGYHELYVNGEKVREDIMNPAQTFYAKRVAYLTYDIKDYLKEGDNVIAIWHAAGWSRWYRVNECPLPPFAFIAQAQIETQDGKKIIVSDDEWLCKESNSRYYGNWDVLDFGGEIVDDSRKEPNWNRADYDDRTWAKADIYVANTAKSDVRFKRNGGF